MTESSGTILVGERRPEVRGAGTVARAIEMSLAFALLATTAVAQNVQPPQQDIQPQQPAAPTQAAPPQNVPAPPPPQSAPAPAPPAYQAPPQYTAPPPPDQAPLPAYQAVPPAPAPAQATPPTYQAPPQQSQPVQSGTPQSPPPPRYPATQPQSQLPVRASPPPQQYPTQPPPPTYARPQWVHTESNYPETPVNGFHYHPFRFHIDGGSTLTQQANDHNFDNGWNAGLGLSWFPTSVLPLGIRVDGTYNHFNARGPFLQQASATYGIQVDNATERMWGGDVDLELDLNFSPYVRAYLLAGGGWYRQQFTYRQTNFSNAVFCDWYGCGPGYVGYNSIVARNTTSWTFAKNAGLGFEFAMGPRASFFVEARYMRLNPNNSKDDFLPIRAGLRF